ncbi:hypothetical protein DPV24_26415, partial [Escherichia coli]|nr:hypothetical protein [Escherichia coli]
FRTGTLIRVLQRYSPRLEGSLLYYPHCNVLPALRAVIDALRIAQWFMAAQPVMPFFGSS